MRKNGGERESEIKSVKERGRRKERERKREKESEREGERVLSSY